MTGQSRVLAACLAGTLACLAGGASADDRIEELVSVKGRVMDKHDKPVAGALIYVRNHDSGEILRTKADKAGKFEVAHAPCHRVSLDVVPEPATGLARAQYHGLNGNDSKQIIVRLERGFVVRGRVVSNGKGVRDVDVVAVPLGEKSSLVDKIHGGGLARTARDGRFSMILTPGSKQLRAVNSANPGVFRLASKTVHVTADCQLPDLVLSSTREASTRE